MNPAYYSFGQSVVAALYQVVVLTALFLGIATALRQRYAPMTALIGAFVTTGIANILIVSLYPDLAVLAAFAWASVPLLQQSPKRSAVFATCTVLGVVAGFQLLVKINSAPTILAIALATSVLLDWRAVGRHCATVVAFAVSTLVWWLVAGQPLANLPLWLKLSAAVASGYSNAMAVPLPALAIPAVVLTLAWMAAICAMFVRGGPELPRRFAALVGLATVIIAKTTYGRYDFGHVYILLSLVVVAVAITPRLETRHRAFVRAAVVILFVGLGGPLVYHRAVVAALSPVRAVDRLVTLAVPGDVDDHVEQAKARQRAVYAVPARFIDAIGRGTVHIDPIETSAVWAYDLAWRPTPVFQTYAAYIPALDTVNSEPSPTDPTSSSPTSPPLRGPPASMGGSPRRNLPALFARSVV